MCIRDSDKRLGGRRVDDDQPRPRVQQVHHAEDDKERDEHCLLYTSDAADDLLCVDLGGRRIIKKKTT